jgi:prevent-host-death family protein
MDDDRYSTYEAKTRFSELLRKVREGRTVTVTYHGEPVAEIRPAPGRTGTAARLARLRDRGIIVDATPRAATAAGAAVGGRQPLQPVARRPGALGRFLSDRDA